MRQFLLFLTILVTATLPAQAFDIFMKLTSNSTATNYVGDSTDSAYPGSAGWVRLNSASFSIKNSIEIGSTSGGAGAGKATFGPLGISKDTWETANHLNPNSAADAALDPDHDGFSNLLEFIAGTNPNSGNSFFKLVAENASDPATQAITLSWSAINGKTYEILAATTPAGPYTAIHSTTATATGTLTFSPPPAAGPYFRLSVR